MKKSLIWPALVLGGVMIAGCDSKSDAPATPASTGGTTAAPAVDTSKVGAAADQAKQGATDAATKAKDAATDTTASAQTQATALMTQVEDYIKQNKLSDADTALTKLEGMKSSLPQSMQDAVAGLRKQLDLLKAGGGAAPAMPAVPAMPN
jgi:hypothetical protein